MGNIKHIDFLDSFLFVRGNYCYGLELQLWKNRAIIPAHQQRANMPIQLYYWGSVYSSTLDKYLLYAQVDFGVHIARL